MNWKQCKNGHLAKTKLDGCSMHMLSYLDTSVSTVSKDCFTDRHSSKNRQEKGVLNLSMVECDPSYVN